MEAVVPSYKIPEASDIVSASPDDPNGIVYTLSYSIRASLRRAKIMNEDGCCPHRTVQRWRCNDCGAFVANFKHFLDCGGHTLYFKLLDWKEIVLPEVTCIYKGYQFNDVVELREYLMLLFSLNLNGPDSVLSTQNLSTKLMNYLQEKDDLFEKHSKNLYPTKILRFNSLFECGNLDRVAIINPSYYIMTVRPDINTCGTSQWFYFSVSNTSARSNIKFEIINLTRKTKLYKAGMRIWVYSRLTETKYGKGWHKACEEISCVKNSHLRKGMTTQDGTDEKHFYSLTFHYKFEFDNDEVFFAYCCPFPYSSICKLIANTEEELNLNKNSESPLRQTKKTIHKSSNYSDLSKNTLDLEHKIINTPDLIYERECYSKTVCGIPAFLISVTATVKSNSIPLEKRKVIFVTSRVHAGETSGSHTFEGFWKFLFSIFFIAISKNR